MDYETAARKMYMNPEHEVMLAIGRLEGKLDSILQMRDEQQQEIREFDKRIRGLEHMKALIIGGAGAVSALTSLVINLIHH